MANNDSITIDSSALAVVTDRRLDRRLGTAFIFMKPTWAVTAKHVVLAGGVVRPEISLLTVNGTVDARLLYKDPFLDLAVLELDAARCDKPLFPGHPSFAKSTLIYAAGYKPTKSDSAGSASIEFNVARSFASEMRTWDVEPVETISFEADSSEGGNSGGPVLGPGGAVIGVIIENFEIGGKRMARAISIAPLIAHLQFQEQRCPPNLNPSNL